jgi:hypothetical protein
LFSFILECFSKKIRVISEPYFLTKMLKETFFRFWILTSNSATCKYISSLVGSTPSGKGFFCSSLSEYVSLDNLVNSSSSFNNTGLSFLAWNEKKKLTEDKNTAKQCCNVTMHCDWIRCNRLNWQKTTLKQPF